MRVDLVHAAPLAAEGGQNRLGLQALFAFGVLLLVAALFGAMRRAWVRRAEQQETELHELPEPPADPGTVLAAPLRGMYLGTVDAGHWLEWISARGLGGRAGAYVTVYSSGVQVDRAGTAFWIPREAVRGARLERAHAGKVASPGRLVVIAWSYGDHELETGFRGEDRARQPKVVRAVHDLIGPAPTAPAEGEITNPRGMQRGRLRLRTRTDAGAGAGAVGQPAGGRGGGRLPMPRPPRQPVGQPADTGRRGAAAYPGARPYADPGRRGGASGEPRPVAQPENSPATTPIPLVVRAKPTGPVPTAGSAAPAPVPTSRADWPQQGSWAQPERPQAGRPQQQPPPDGEQPGWSQPSWPPAPHQRPGQPQSQPQPYPPQPYPPQPPAAGVPQDPDAAYIDPLTSPLGQVVRRMHDDR